MTLHGTGMERPGAGLHLHPITANYPIDPQNLHLYQAASMFTRGPATPTPPEKQFLCLFQKGRACISSLLFTKNTKKAFATSEFVRLQMRMLRASKADQIVTAISILRRNATCE
jgi:hypothetical protein